jgi:hypothetical protein
MTCAIAETHNIFNVEAIITRIISLRGHKNAWLIQSTQAKWSSSASLKDVRGHCLCATSARM